MVSTIDERDIESIAKRINIKLNTCQVNRV
jgi:hypothetical protein